MNKELIKRTVTSFFLIILLSLVFFYSYILLISLVIISLIAWIEFNGLISKIFLQKNLKTRSTLSLFKIISLLYLILFSVFIFIGINQEEPNFKLHMVYLFSICICSDIGGLIFGKLFKGKKLTKISPNKTISGSLGSFVLSASLIPIFYYIIEQFNNLLHLIILSIIVSLSCQLGDLLVSFLKRKAKVKDTGDLLPGHGGVLDRIDGILFAMPVGILLWKFLIITI
jgi:phosphatidate cytidylyltransferase